LTAESRAVIDMDGHGEGLYQVGDISGDEVSID
jgi:hypothetical protein